MVTTFLNGLNFDVGQFIGFSEHCNILAGEKGVSPKMAKPVRTVKRTLQWFSMRAVLKIAAV